MDKSMAFNRGEDSGILILKYEKKARIVKIGVDMPA